MVHPAVVRWEIAQRLLEVDGNVARLTVFHCLGLIGVLPGGKLATIGFPSLANMLWYLATFDGEVQVDHLGQVMVW